MVTGRPGTGKTTLAETFLKDLDPTRVLAERVAVSGLEAHDLLRAVAYACGIEASGLDKATLRHRIQRHFILQEQRGRRALLIFDEAQGLPSSSLEELRLLANLQAGYRPLMQLFLVGQGSLRDLMRTPGMDQFQQRIIATCHLKPPGLRETREYIKHRLYQAGWKGDPELSGAALLAIHQRSRGVPRHINKRCNRLLVLGYGKGKHILDETAEKIPIAAAPVVDPPAVESVTPPEQVSDTTHDESEINGLEAGQNNVAMAAADRTLPEFESMDAPAAGDRPVRMVPAEDHPVAPPVSREE